MFNWSPCKPSYGRLKVFINLLKSPQIRLFPFIHPDQRKKLSQNTGWPVKHGRVFLQYLWKKWLVQCVLLYTCTQDKPLFTRYQKHTAMFNWSPCIPWYIFSNIYQIQDIYIFSSRNSKQIQLVEKLKFECWLTGDQLQGTFSILQGHQLNMVVFSWYLVKHDLPSVCYCTSVHWTGHFLQGTRKTRPCLSVQVVYITNIIIIKAKRHSWTPKRLYLRITNMGGRGVQEKVYIF